MMAERLERALALGIVERQLRDRNSDLDIHLVGQAHYGEIGFAFIEIHGASDQIIRRQLRKEAGERVDALGFPVNLILGKDVFHVRPIRPEPIGENQVLSGMKRPTFDDIRVDRAEFIGPPAPPQIPKLTSETEREAVRQMMLEYLAARIAAETEAARRGPA